MVAGNVLLEACYGAGGRTQPFSGPLATACPFLEGCVALQTQAAPGLLAEFLGVAERREAQLSACTPQCGVLEADKGKSGMGVGCERFKGKDCWDFNQAKP